jgi:hypothetical protein
VHDRPTALELLEAVSEFLSEEILPTVDDQRLKFRTLVALNALRIASRELAEADGGPGPSTDDLTELARRIRAGDADVDVAQLKRLVAAKLVVSNPDYLDRYR